MRRQAGLAAFALIAACGRIGFEGRAGGDAVDGDGMIDAPPAVGKVSLGPGADARRIIAPEGSLQRLYVVLGDNHMMTSADGGVTFTECGRLPGYVVDVIGTPAGAVYVSGGSGVFQSLDRCASFSDTGLNGYTGSIQVDGATLLAGQAAGLSRRTGTTWSPVASPATGRFVSDLYVSPTVYLAGSDNGISRSTNGANWALSNTGLQNVDIKQIAGAPGRIYVTTGDGVHVSTDDGVTWARVYNNYSDVIAADPGDSQFVAHWWYGGLIVSANGGTSWSTDARTPPMSRSRVNDILFDPAGSGRVIVATSRGLFAAPDHALALAQISDLDAWTVWSVARASASGNVFYGTTTGILRESASGRTLLDPGGPDYSTAFRVIAPGDGSTIYATGRALVTSTDQGDSFTEAYSPGIEDGYLTIDVTSTGSRTYVTTHGRAGVSTGGAWTFRTLGAVRWTNGVLAVGDTTLVATEMGVYATVDNGLTYALIPGMSRDTYALVTLADGSVLAGTDRGIYRAATPGGTWTAHALLSTTVTSLLVIGTTIVAGENDRVSYSTDGGLTFNQLPGFTGHSPQALAADPSGGVLIGTSGYGLHRVELP